MKNPKIRKQFKFIRDYIAETYPEMKKVKLNIGCPVIDERRKDGSKRSYMHVGHKPFTVCVHPAAERLPIHQLQGIFLHEFGHLLSEGGEGEANAIIRDAFGVRILYGKDLLQFIERTI